MVELVGRSDSDWAGDSSTRQSVTGYQCNVLGVMLCDRSLTSVLALAKQSSTQPARENFLGLAELFKGLHCKVSVRLEMNSDSARQVSREEDREDLSISNSLPRHTTVDQRTSSTIRAEMNTEETRCIFIFRLIKNRNDCNFMLVYGF